MAVHQVHGRIQSLKMHRA
uniref:Uncharacterized protein n=1 Tax=Arundo donax TaxID=35708 RepID=A0A0A9F7U8_ARUDO